MVKIDAEDHSSEQRQEIFTLRDESDDFLEINLVEPPFYWYCECPTVSELLINGVFWVVLWQQALLGGLKAIAIICSRSAERVIQLVLVMLALVLLDLMPNSKTVNHINRRIRSEDFPPQKDV